MRDAIRKFSDLPDSGNYTVEFEEIELWAVLPLFQFLRELLDRPNIDGTPYATVTIPFQQLEPHQVRALWEFLDAGYASSSVKLVDHEGRHIKNVYLTER